LRLVSPNLLYHHSLCRPLAIVKLEGAFFDAKFFSCCDSHRGKVPNPMVWDTMSHAECLLCLRIEHRPTNSTHLLSTFGFKQLNLFLGGTDLWHRSSRKIYICNALFIRILSWVDYSFVFLPRLMKYCQAFAVLKCLM